MKKENVQATGVRFSITKSGKEVGRAYLYLLNNDLHKQPFGLLEDVFVDGEYRGTGIAKELLNAVSRLFMSIWHPFSVFREVGAGMDGSKTV